MELLTIICKICGKTANKTTNGPQKYCAECSIKKDVERKENYHSLHRQKINERRRFIVEELRQEKSQQGSSVLNWPDEEETGEEVMVMLVIPFTTSLSKNHSWAFTKKGHVFLKAETRAAQEALIEKLSEYRGKFKENKIWVELLIEKPNGKSGDAINFVDRICDAIKQGIAIDDRWFCFKKIDWRVIKNNPRIFITIHQKNTQDMRICSICGRILSLDNFYKAKSNKLGVGRECKKCVIHVDKIKREQKKQKISEQKINVNPLSTDMNNGMTQPK